MNYLEWNTAIYNYFFNEGDKNEYIVLAVTPRVVKEIAGDFIEDPFNDLKSAVNQGPIDSNQPRRFVFDNKRDKDILAKAKYLASNPEYTPNYTHTQIKVWNHSIPPYLGYLAFVVWHANESNLDSSEADERGFWRELNNNLEIKVPTNHHGFILDLFRDLKTRSGKLGYHNFYCDSIYQRKKNVGTIYSQLPLTNNEEDEIIASLYALQRENPIYYDEVINCDNNDSLEEFLNEQSNYLNNITDVYLRDDNSPLKQLIISTLKKSLKQFKKELENLDSKREKEIKQLLATRGKPKDYKPVFKKFIKNKNGNICIEYAILIDDKDKKLPTEGPICFQKRSCKFEINTESYILVNLDKKIYRKYLTNVPEDGTYNYGAEVKVEVRGSKLQFPIFYQQVEENLFLINEEVKLEFDANNPIRIISGELIENDYLFLVQIVEIPIAHHVGIKYFYKINYTEIPDEGVQISNRNIQVVEKYITLDVSGLNDGLSGLRSFHFGFPVRIQCDGIEVTMISVNNKEGEVVVNYRVVQEDILPAKIGFEVDLPIGEYNISLYNKEKKIILSQGVNNTFTITNNNKDVRIVGSQYFEICKFGGLANYNSFIVDNNQVADFNLDQDSIEAFIDIAIKTGGISTIYSDKFRKILRNHLSSRIDCYSDEDQYTILKEISKIIFRLLNDLGVINKVDYRVNWIKPYWRKSSIANRFYLRGSLCKEEKVNLDYNQNVKKQEQVVYEKFSNSFLVKPVTLKVTLPSIYYTDGLESKNLPFFVATNPNKSLDFIFKSDYEYSPCEEDFNLFRFRHQANGYVYFNTHHEKSISIFNLLTFRFEPIKEDTLRSYFQYSGHRLIRVQTDRNYNKYKENHYFLFSKDRGHWGCKYYRQHRYMEAKYELLKVSEYLDFTKLTLGESIPNNFFDFLYNKTTSPEPKTTILNAKESNNLFDLCLIMNSLYNLGSQGGNKMKKNLFLYDNDKKTFGVNQYMGLPESIHKHIISLSGVLPVIRLVEVEVLNDNLVEIVEGKDLYQNKKVPFNLYFGVPEEIAFKVSNELLGTIAINLPNGTAKPYKKITL